MNPRYITKSRFKLALRCPAKLYYEGKPEYANQNVEDTFLLSLAEGGFQVGELAKCYYPGGHDIKTLDSAEALAKTAELLKQDSVIIYEAAVRFADFFIRVDILVKRGSSLEVVEVKSKSFDSDDESFLTKKGTVSSGWYEYIADAAFQRHVVRSAFPACSVSAFLMTVDKTAVCPVDGLNQKFRIVKSPDGRKTVAVSPGLTPEDTSVRLLEKVNIDDCCDSICRDTFGLESGGLSFTDYLDFLAENYRQDRKIAAPPSRACAACEFRTTAEDEANGLKSGFRECWKETLGWNDADFQEETIFAIWNLHYRKKEKLINERRLKLAQVTEEDIAPKDDGKPGISAGRRQWLQVQKAQSGDATCWIDAGQLKREMSAWVYPLHFIDFETSMVAIPFNKGRHPYEGIAFQFSHHLVGRDGNVEHRGQYLNVTPGVFPNYDFVRALKSELENDDGSIFRYAAHENTYLNFIYRQLQEDAGVPDRDDLCRFIRTITRSSRSSPESWEGPRSMIDMLELVKRYYYHPDTGGSNSIKYVLPAVLNSSAFLQQKYGKPVYGAEGGIKSLNYRDWQWVVFEEGRVKDPYKLLPKLFQDVSDKDLGLLSGDDELRDGGAALMAYARMQFEEMTDYERQEISRALLKYCELDTLAMVMLYEGWHDLITDN